MACDSKPSVQGEGDLVAPLACVSCAEHAWLIDWVATRQSDSGRGQGSAGKWGGARIMKDKLAHRRQALTGHARPIHRNGDAADEERLPDGLLQHDALRVVDQPLALGGVAGGAGARHERGDIIVGVVEEVARPWPEQHGERLVVTPCVVEQEQIEVLPLVQDGSARKCADVNGAYPGVGELPADNRRDLVVGCAFRHKHDHLYAAIKLRHIEQRTAARRGIRIAEAGQFARVPDGVWRQRRVGDAERAERGERLLVDHCGDGLTHPQVLPAGVLEIEPEVGKAANPFVPPEARVCGQGRDLLVAEAHHQLDTTVVRAEYAGFNAAGQPEVWSGFIRNLPGTDFSVLDEAAQAQGTIDLTQPHGVVAVYASAPLDVIDRLNRDPRAFLADAAPSYIALAGERSPAVQAALAEALTLRTAALREQAAAGIANVEDEVDALIAGRPELRPRLEAEVRDLWPLVSR